MPSPTIAVVVPNRNHAEFLPDSIRSIIGQTRPPDEVIIIDDASEDNSLSIIEHLSAGRPSWRIVRRERREGVVSALNHGLRLAESDFVVFLGADDGLANAYLETVERVLSRHPDAGLVCSCVAVVEAGKAALRPIVLPADRESYIEPAQFRRLLKVADNFFIGTTVCYSRIRLLKIGGFIPQLGPLTDGLAARRLAARHGFVFVPEVLGYWRLHGDNFSVLTVTQSDHLAEIFQIAHAVLGGEPAGTFPEDYPALLERRTRFGAARLAVLDRRLSPAERAARVSALLRAGPVEQFLTAAILRMGGMGRVALLAWLTLRQRPYGLYRLVAAALTRRSIKIPSRTPFDRIAPTNRLS